MACKIPEIDFFASLLQTVNLLACFKLWREIGKTEKIEERFESRRNVLIGIRNSMITQSRLCHWFAERESYKLDNYTRLISHVQLHRGKR